MRLIPVIDLMGGHAVHARRGERSAYRPVRSRLCASSEPGDVVQAYLRLHPFDTIYIADLDAITETGHNLPVIETLHRRFPGVCLWVDSGIGTRAALDAWYARGLGRPVLGSESMRDMAAFGALFQGPGKPEPVLSLDFAHGALKGPTGLLAAPDAWPYSVIVMTLERVGAGAGPALDQWRQVAGVAGNRRLYAAGGVRSPQDLAEIAGTGAAGVLLASALHDGAISREDLAKYPSN